MGLLFICISLLFHKYMLPFFFWYHNYSLGILTTTEVTQNKKGKEHDDL